MNTKVESNIDYDEIADAGPIRRSAATAIDIILVFIIRAIAIQTASIIWFSDKIITLSKDFTAFFGTDVIDSSEKIVFIQSHPVFTDFIYLILAILFIGSLYYAYLHSSSYHATIGKRLMKVEIINSDYSKLSFFKSFIIYYTSLLPIFYITYIVMYSYSVKISLIYAMFANIYHIICTLLMVGLSAFFSAGFRRQMGFDILFKTVYLNNATRSKYPWN